MITKVEPGDKFSRVVGSLDIQTLGGEVRVEEVTPESTVTATLHAEDQFANVTFSRWGNLRLR